MGSDAAQARLLGAYEIATHRAALTRAVYIVSVTSTGPREEVLYEFHQAIGDILEGVALTDLKLMHIDSDSVRQEVAWLRERKS